MSTKISRSVHADLFGPTKSDPVRLADTDLLTEVEKDFTVYGKQDEDGRLDPNLEWGVLQLRPFFFEWPLSDSKFEHCCVYLDHATRFCCDMHASPFECWDNEFVYNEVFDEYGAISRNPENHCTMLRFCPFCGAKLRASRRDDWQQELTAQGFDLFGDAMGQVLDRTGSYTKAWRAIGVPERYLTAQWRSDGREAP